jgi:amino acid transporter
MVGAGIFALLGEAGKIALSAVWISFLLAGIIAALQGYSFSKLGTKYASPSGMMGYIAAGFGKGSRVASVFSWLVWASSMIVVAMVAVSFGSYAATVAMGGGTPSATLTQSMATLIIVAVVVLAALGGAGAVAKIQAFVIRLVIIVLLGLAVVTMLTANWTMLAPSTYPSVSAIIGSIALTFFAFLGFGVISYTAKDLKDQADMGPATYIALAVATLTYVAISLGVFGQLTPEQVAAAGPTAIALAAQTALAKLTGGTSGTIAYAIVTITAMLSTAGAVNSTVYPVPGLLGSLAEQGVFPPFFGKKVGRFPISLVMTGLIIIVFVWAFNLSAIASLGSAVALLIFLMISLGHFRIRSETGANAAVLVIGMLTVIITLVGFFATTLKTSPASLVAFVALALLAVVVDTVWRAVRDARSPTSHAAAS